MGTISIWHWLIVAFWIAIIAPPIAKILHRTGHSGRWAVVAFIPLLNLIGLWIFAFTKWPATAGSGSAQDQWSAAENNQFRDLLGKR